jgi:hypothetical protein
MAYKMDGNEIAKTRAAFADRNLAFNQLRSAKIDEVQMRAQNIDTQTAAAETEVANALERGDWSAQAAAQRRVSELAARRVAVESEYQRWQSQPVYSHDPVEDLIKSKQSEPLTQQWLRSHESDAVVLATNSDPARVAQIQASHAAAVAKGHAPGTAAYFKGIDDSLGGKTTRGSDSDGGKRVVRVVKGRQSGDNELTAGELRAANEDVLWGREGGAKCGTPVGVEEYIKRRNAMRAQPGWFDKLQD